MTTVTVIPLTRLEGKRRKPYAFEVLLPPGTVGANVTHIVMPHQIRTISKLRLIDVMGRIASRSLREAIEERLLEHLAIPFES